MASEHNTVKGELNDPDAENEIKVKRETLGMCVRQISFSLALKRS